MQTPKTFSVRELIVMIAKWQLSVKESPAGSNKTKFGVWYGMDGVKWCAVFVSWVYAQAGTFLGALRVTGFSDMGFHHCQSAFNHWTRNGKQTKDPKPGDIVIYDWEQPIEGSTLLADHVGIFIGWKDGKRESGIFEAVEGNTSSASDSDGGEVEYRTRSIKFVKGFFNLLGDE